MKTTKKGFTLIELIVVIAIIGVLAAILVPSMLGYVKKSKIQGANSTASTLAKAGNSAVTDLDEEDKTPGTVTIHDSDCSSEGDGSGTGGTGGTGGTATNTEIADAVQTFFNDFKKGANMALHFEDGVCVSAAVKSGAYYGTYPAVFTAKNWDSYKGTVNSVDTALTQATNKATAGKTTGSDS